MSRRIITSLASAEWAGLFTGFTRSAFRLEALQHAADPDEEEAFVRFLAGQDPGVDLSWWIELAKGHTAAGRRMCRVRVVIEPPSDYTRFELAHFPAMAEAGDDIRIIVAGPGTWPAGMPRHDFWLFDDRDVWVLNYDDAGMFLSAELQTDRRVITDHLCWRDAALRQSIPVREYLAMSARRVSAN
ncbi:MAG TPA: hypothetical protein VN748_09770 [Pseudonocardiaceae bacterium]|jgi:hypothetical protein|nr:hypothetical protein [Pseudonocardiaceae bacterium]